MHVIGKIKNSTSGNISKQCKMFELKDFMFELVYLHALPFKSEQFVFTSEHDFDLHK